MIYKTKKTVMLLLISVLMLPVVSKAQVKDEIMELRAGLNVTSYQKSFTGGFRAEFGHPWDKICGVGRVYWNVNTNSTEMYVQAGVGYKFKSKYRYRTGIYSNIRVVIYPVSSVRYVYMDSDDLVPMVFVEYNLPNYRNLGFEMGAAYDFIGSPNKPDRLYPVFRITHKLLQLDALNNDN